MNMPISLRNIPMHMPMMGQCYVQPMDLPLAPVGYGICYIFRTHMLRMHAEYQLSRVIYVV